MLEQLPRELFLLPRLGALNASSNNLRELPGELWACTSLRRLELQCNPLGAGFWERGPRPRKVRPHLGDDLLTAYSDRQTAFHPSELPAPPVPGTRTHVHGGHNVSGGGLLPFDSTMSSSSLHALAGGGGTVGGGGRGLGRERGRSASVSSRHSRGGHSSRWRQNVISVFPPVAPAWLLSRRRKVMVGSASQSGRGGRECAYIDEDRDGAEWNNGCLALPLLQYVDISGCKVSEILPTISGLTGLATLKANDNDLKRLPDALADL